MHMWPHCTASRINLATEPYTFSRIFTWPKLRGQVEFCCLFLKQTFVGDSTGTLGLVELSMRRNPIDNYCKGTKEIKKVRAISEYFHCMVGNATETWSFCNSRSGCDVLWVWFICPFVLSEHGVNITTPLGVCTKDKNLSLLLWGLSLRLVASVLLSASKDLNSINILH